MNERQIIQRIKKRAEMHEALFDRYDVIVRANTFGGNSIANVKRNRAQAVLDELADLKHWIETGKEQDDERPGTPTEALPESPERDRTDSADTARDVPKG